MLHKIKFKLFDIANWFILYYLIQYVLAPLVFFFYRNKTFLHVSFSSFDNTSYSVFLIITGLLFFILGNRVNIKIRKIFFLDRVSFKRLQVQAVFFILLSVVLFIVMIKHEGGIATFLENLSFFRVQGMIGKGIYYYPALGILPMLILWLWYKAKEEDTRIPHILIGLMLFVYLVTVFLLGFRGPLISFLLSLLVFINKFIYKIKIKQFITIGILLYFILASGAYLQQKEKKDIRDILEYSLFNVLERSNGILVLNQTVEYRKEYNSSGCIKDMLKESITIIIPKTFWKDKPLPLSRIYTEEVFKTSNTNISPTILGYIVWLINAYAIIPLMFLLGFCYRFITNYFNQLDIHGNSVVNIWFIINFPSFVIIAESPQIAINQIFMSTFVVLSLYLINHGGVYLKRISIWKR